MPRPCWLRGRWPTGGSTTSRGPPRSIPAVTAGMPPTRAASRSTCRAPTHPDSRPPAASIAPPISPEAASRPRSTTCRDVHPRALVLDWLAGGHASDLATPRRCARRPEHQGLRRRRTEGQCRRRPADRGVRGATHRHRRPRRHRLRGQARRGCASTTGPWMPPRSPRTSGGGGPLILDVEGRGACRARLPENSARREARPPEDLPCGTDSQ